MHWVVQTNIFAEEGFEALLAAFERLGIYQTWRSAATPQRTYSLVKVVPFTGELHAIDGDLPLDGANAIVMGSYSLARVAKAKNWKPGAFLDNLDFEVQRRWWGDRMLNHDALVTTFDSVPFQKEPFFLRPVHDTKAFTGMVVDWGYYEQWRDSLRRLPETVDPVNDPLGVNVLTRDTPVMVCTKKEVYSETRCWVIKQPIMSVSGIVAGVAATYTVVTASRYKRGTLKHYEEVRGSRWDNDLIAFAEDMANEWSPNAAYVMDIAETPHGYKVVEVNNLNSAGWYKGDMQKLVHALEEMPAT